MKRLISIFALSLCLVSMAMAQGQRRLLTREDGTIVSKADMVGRSVTSSTQPTSDAITAHNPTISGISTPPTNLKELKVYFEITGMPDFNDEAAWEYLLKVYQAKRTDVMLVHVTKREEANEVLVIPVRYNYERGQQQRDYQAEAFNQGIDRLADEARNRSYRSNSGLGTVAAIGLDLGKQTIKREPYKPTDDFAKIDLRIRKETPAGALIKEKGTYYTLILQRKGGYYRPEKIKVVDGTLESYYQVLSQLSLLPDDVFLQRHPGFYYSLVATAWHITQYM